MSGLTSLIGRSAYAGPLLAALGAVFAIGLVIAIAGFDPIAALTALLSQSLGSVNGVTEVLVRTIPLTLTGLGITVAFRARMFNVGGDGQIILGAIAFVGCGMLFPTLTGWLLLPLAVIAGILGGAIWGGIAGVLRARYNASEIIVTIMLTYVAFQGLGWAIRGPLQESMGVFPRSEAVPEAAKLGLLLDGSRLHWGLLIALGATVVVALVLRYTSFGYRLDAIGESPLAARHGGIGERATVILSLAVSGGLAGLAGAVEIAGVHGRLHDAFAEGTGITAIAVALLARLNPVFVPLSAAMFAVLSVGVGGLQRQLGIPFPLVHLIEGIVILAFLIGTRLQRRTVEG